MQRLDYSARERIHTDAGAMQLDPGRPSLGEVVKLFVFCAAMLLVINMGVLLVSLVWDGSPGEWRVWSALRLFIGGTGGSIAALAAYFGTGAGRYFWDEWRAYVRRRDDWHYAGLEAYERAGGQVVDRQLTVKALTVHEPAHLLLVSLALAEKIRAEQAAEPSLSALQGDIWLGRIKVGELNKPAAEEFLKALNQMGVITGRSKGRAGQLATVEPAGLIELVSNRAGRVRSEPEVIEAKGGE